MNLCEPRRDTVIVYREHLLPYSETFIRAQVLALRRWKPILVGETVLKSGLSLSGIHVELPFPKRGMRWHRAAFRALKPSRVVYPPVARQIQNLNARLLHAHFGPSALNIWPYAKAAGLPMLVTLHGFDINVERQWWESGQGGRSMRRYPDELLALSEQPGVRFLAASVAIHEAALRFGIPPERTSVSYIGVDLSRFPPGPTPIHLRKRRILFVGRLVENKGVAYLIQAFAKVKESVSDAELVVVGDGPLRAQLEAQSAAFGRSVTFRGSLPPDEVHGELQEAQVLCLPSVTIANGASEGLGMVLIEAQCAGLPVISSARGGGREVLQHGISGYRFDERDIGTLADQLASLLRDNCLLNRMSLAAVENSRRFDIGKCIESVEVQYDELTKASA